MNSSLNFKSVFHYTENESIDGQVISQPNEEICGRNEEKESKKVFCLACYISSVTKFSRFGGCSFIVKIKYSSFVLTGV